MGNNFILVNPEWKEYITFLGYSKEMELIGNNLTAKMVAYYLFEHNGQELYFVGDQWQVGMVMANLNKIINEYECKTLEILHEMIQYEYITAKELETFSPSTKKLLDQKYGGS